MPSNRKYVTRTLHAAVSPAAAENADPVLIGSLPGVAQRDADSGVTVVELGAEYTIARLSVLASTEDTSSPLSGASAVALGDPLYLNPTSGVLSKDSTGGPKLFGYALGTPDANGAYSDATVVAAGDTDEIDVLIAAL